MKIIIAGAYAIGTHLARLLSRSNEEITLIDESEERLASIGSDCDLLTMLGKPTSLHILRDAGVADADLFIAVTPVESTNITAKRQRGLQRGKPGSPLPCFASFCRSKRKAPAASGANYAFVKGSAAPTGEIKLLPFAGNPSVTAAPCQLPLRRGALGQGSPGAGRRRQALMKP